MARRVITLDEKIKAAEAAVAAVKAKYDAALDELEKLVTKKKQLDDALFELTTSPEDIDDDNDLG